MIESIQMFESKGIPTEIAMTIIQYLWDWKGEQHIRIDPMDDLYKKYGIVNEDLDEFVLSVADDYGRTPPNDTTYWTTEILTVYDLARFVMTFPEKPLVVG